jgi:hypothetical protein
MHGRTRGGPLHAIGCRSSTLSRACDCDGATVTRESRTTWPPASVVVRLNQRLGELCAGRGLPGGLAPQSLGAATANRLADGSNPGGDVDRRDRSAPAQADGAFAAVPLAQRQQHGEGTSDGPLCLQLRARGDVRSGTRVAQAVSPDVVKRARARSDVPPWRCRARSRRYRVRCSARRRSS